ncbi:hypothetical protein ACFY3J_35130 [Streptomyces sp. NPDC001231]|uniref:hypothetical protein n=1 Tax=Streptomyces sp. NPDC001231 TaxID=3364549 RepID=UPI0036CD7AE8
MRGSTRSTPPLAVRTAAGRFGQRGKPTAQLANYRAQWPTEVQGEVWFHIGSGSQVDFELFNVGKFNFQAVRAAATVTKIDVTQPFRCNIP